MVLDSLDMTSAVFPGRKARSLIQNLIIFGEFLLVLTYLTEILCHRENLSSEFPTRSDTLGCTTTEYG